MKNKYLNFTLITILLTGIIFSIGIYIRYVIDPVGLNNKYNLGLFKDYALAYRTQKFVELNNIKPDTLMIGGSRVHYLLPSDVRKYTNDKVYNLGFSFSTLEEQYYFLKYSIENMNIKNVIIGINLYTFSEKIEENNNDFDKDIFENHFGFFQQIKHYLEVPIFKYLKYVYNNPNLQKSYENGGITPYLQSIVLKDGWEKLKKISLSGYEKKYSNYLEYGETTVQLDYFKKMIKLCKDNNINYKVFTTVIHKEQLKILEKLDKMDIYYKWKEDIVKITPYWDFMYVNKVSEKDEYFIDTSHIKQEYGNLYFEKLFNNTKEVKKDDDFGIYIDKNNIKESLNYLKRKNVFN